MTRKTFWLVLSHLYSLIIGFFLYGEFVDHDTPGVIRWIVALIFQAVFLYLYLTENEDRKTGQD